MLKVTIELHPYGDATSKKTLHDVYIANVGGPEAMGFAHYHVWLGAPPRDGETIRPRHPDAKLTHSRQDGALVLVRKALEALEGAGGL